MSYPDLTKIGSEKLAKEWCEFAEKIIGLPCKKFVFVNDDELNFDIAYNDPRWGEIDAIEFLAEKYGFTGDEGTDYCEENPYITTGLVYDGLREMFADNPNPDWD